MDVSGSGTTGSSFRSVVDGHTRLSGPEGTPLLWICARFDQLHVLGEDLAFSAPSATGLVSGGQSFCAILDSGAADCWGSGYDGDLGDSTANNSDVQVPVLGIGP